MAALTVTEIEVLVREIVLGAAAVAADRGVEPESRRNHAGLVHALAYHIGPHELVCAEVIRAAQSSTGDHRVVRNLLQATAGLAPDEGRLALPVRRLCQLAFERGHDETLLIALMWLARVSRDRNGDVPVGWFAAVSRVSERRLPYLLREWVSRFGAGHPGLCALTREHESCLLARTMTADTVRAIHAVQPTVSGWLALARDQEAPGGALGLSFGDATAEALATVREAREGTGDDAVRGRLSLWLVELEES